MTPDPSGESETRTTLSEVFSKMFEKPFRMPSNEGAITHRGYEALQTTVKEWRASDSPPGWAE